MPGILEMQFECFVFSKDVDEVSGVVCPNLLAVDSRMLRAEWLLGNRVLYDEVLNVKCLVAL